MTIWPLAKLSEVAAINPRGDRPSFDEAISFVGMADLSAETGVAGPGHKRAFAEVSKGYTVFRDQDLLLAKITPCFENGKIGQAKISSRVGVGSTEFHVIRPESDRLDSRFALHYLRQKHIRVAGERRMTGSGGQRRVPTDYVAQLQIPLPPIEEQRRIAAILDHADGLVAKSQAGRAMLRSLPTSVFNEIPDLFAAPLVPLSELCRSPDDIRCGPFGTQLNRSEFRDHGVPLWGIKQVNKGFSIATREFVSHETATRLASYGIDPGDIVMTRKGTVGNCAVYPKGWPPGIMHSDLLRIRLDGLRALPEFLSHQLHHSQEVAGQLAKQNSGAVMPGLNVTRLKSLEVRVPSLAVQRTFVGELNAIHALASVWEERGRVLVAAVNTLQARAFSGRL